MKFLILVVFATLGVACADVDLWDWNPVPVNDSIVQQALDAKKSQIILDVIQSHPNITHNPIFDLNSADKMYDMEKIFPPFVYYRLNLTLAIRKRDPFNSKFIGIYTPIVTFNVTLKTQTFDSHVDVIGNPKYAGIKLPHLPETIPVPELVKAPFQDNDFKADYQGTIRNVNLPSNDTGLTIAIAALQDKIWQKLEENNINRPNATSAPKDDFVPSINYTLYKYSRNKTTGNLQSQYSVSLNVLSTAKDSPPFSFLLIKPKKPVKIWVTFQVQHSSGAETFELTYFNFVADSSEKDSSPLLKLDLISAGPNKDDHDCNHYLGYPEAVDPKSKHLWTVFNAVKQDVLQLVNKVNLHVSIPDDSIFIFNAGKVQYKDNHGDLDKPIVREITAKFTILEPSQVGPLLLPKTLAKTTVVLQESISPLNATSSYKLLQVDNCKVGGVCPY